MSDEERVVSWLEENYKGLILGIIIGLSTLYGYKAYISNENTEQLELSRQYDLAIVQYNSGKVEPLIKFSKDNIIQNPKNIYTSLANLYSAKEMYAKSNYKEAYSFLDHIIMYSPDAEIQSLAKYRKAKLLIEQEVYNDAHLLLGDKPVNYQHLELKGDLYLIQKKYLEAINHYNEALTYRITPNERKNIIAKINLIK
jgi:predicted negative regulator of RcsB-dependent stress response